MSSQAKKFYITTSIPYANAAPHAGHILDPLIADVLARYHRIKGGEVRFLVGTDEHGVKIVRKAEEERKTPQLLVDENSGKYKEVHKLLNISWNDFIRTSDRKRHWAGAEKMWRALVASGDVYKKQYRGLYCVGHEAFITEKDLVGGRCQDHQKEPEVIEEENWFFKLSKYAKQIEKAITSGVFEVLPESRKNEALSFIQSGLEDISISRPSKDILWGVPVPGDSTQTMYVWLEALVSYISSIGYGHDDPESRALFEKWWPAEAQIVGKDNLRFHAVIWPGMLFSAGLALPELLFVHGFVTVDGQKISKTVGNIIEPQEIVSKYGVDPVRYYFLREFPSHEDGDFSYKKFEDRYNGDLANGVGNLVARVAALGEKLGRVQFDFARDVTPEVKKETERVFSAYEKHLGVIRLNEALSDVWGLIGFADRRLNEEKPWAAENQRVIEASVLNAGYIISTIANLLEPFLPETSEKIKAQIHIEDSVLRIRKGEALFPRLDKTQH